ncbi:type 2 isopentenyl-diphosphate Delta-isomerase [Cohnella sp. GCM10027633]|uniref:type 2 isopentenyl-diphosphate Delta-isomerase n=1 Tax=unclassified Cohnella TaxID=2636738 RepID=UPI00363A44A6
MRRQDEGGRTDNVDGRHGTADRKADHIRIALEESVEGRGVTNGFERYRFKHSALPEIDYADVRLDTSFLGRKLGAPLLVSSMTGGTPATGRINRTLAAAAEARGWAIGLGSARSALEREQLAETFQVRREAPTALLLANLGAVQLNYGMGVDHCLRAVELAEADMLVLHLNALQETFQPEGNTNFRGLMKRIEEVCSRLEVPVGVKEVGWGIDGSTARRLAEAGASFIDVAGAGGTSWSQVEKFRNPDAVAREAADAFADWGIPTAECVREVRAALGSSYPVIASGGLHTGVEAAKAIALGANMAGFGRALLRDAVDSAEKLVARLSRVEKELRTAMFAIGAADVVSLGGTDRLMRT